MALYVLEWSFPAEREKRLAVRPRHRAFLEQLRVDGRLIAAGPWSDDSGALIVLKASSRDELERWLEADPYVRDGVGERTLREWTPIIGGTVDASAGDPTGARQRAR